MPPKKPKMTKSAAKKKGKKLMKLRKQHKSKKVKKVKAPSVAPEDCANDTYAGLSSDTDDGTQSPPPPSSKTARYRKGQSGRTRK